MAQRSAITLDGAARTTFVTSLDLETVARAYADARADGPARACELRRVTHADPTAHLRFAAFQEFVVRCAAAKYAGVGEGRMSLAQRVDGLLDNLAGTKDEAAVVHAATDIVVAPHDRFDALDASLRLPGETEDQHEAWTACWLGLRLDDLPGFPLWEERVHNTLHEGYEPLCAVFAHYCKTAGEASEDASRMNKFEWLTYCRDLKLLSKSFSYAAACLGARLPRPSADQRTACLLSQP